MRKRLDDIQDTMQSEKAWWEKRRAAIQSDFMKELDGSDKSSSTNPPSVDGDAVLVDATNNKSNAVKV